MSVQNVRPPAFGQPDDGLCKSGNLAQFAKAGRARNLSPSSVKGQTLDRFLGLHRSFGPVVRPRDPTHFETACYLRFEDRAGAESIAAM